VVDAAYAEGRREAESLYANKQRQLNQQLADLRDISEHLSAGRQWLVDYMKQHQAQAQAQPAVSATNKLEAATRAVWSRDVMRRAQQQADPADEVQPRLDVQDADADADEEALKLKQSLTGLGWFRVTDPEVVQ
jgi:hypothetical protein